MDFNRPVIKQPEIDFLDGKNKIVNIQPPKKPKGCSKIIISLVIIFVIFFTAFSVNVISSGENLSHTLGNVSLWGQLKHLIGSDDKKLNGEEEDRINALLLGIGGGDHSGPMLTDTIIIASFKPSTKQVALISIPRDLSVQVPGYGWRKINSINSLGESKESGQGGEFTKKMLSQIFNLPIHYYVRIDFAGFQKIIDDLGGVTIDVENVVDDWQYPVEGKENATTSERYEHLYIKTGSQEMDGEMALKYVRSRHAAGIEGSDFARSKRQQKLLMAVKNKGLSFGTLINPYKISRVMNTLSEHLATNAEVWEILRVSNFARQIDETNITRRVFDDSPGGQLVSGITAEGAYVLQPKTGNMTEIQTIIQTIFDPTMAEKLQPKKIEIENGTKISGLAYQTSQYLESLGYQIVRIKNAPTQDYQKTVVYNLKEGQTADETASNLAKLLTAEKADTVPNWAKSTTTPWVSPQADILIILGQDRRDL